LTASQRTDLDQLGVRYLFVRAATMSFDGERMQAILPQRWLSPWPRVWLVLNFDGGARGHFAEVAPQDVATQTVKAFLDAKRAAVGSGIVGLQIDLDCPTRQLPRYADLLREVRRRLPKDTKLSITGLQTWLSSNELSAVVAQVDLFTPQFYEGRVPRTLKDRASLNDLASLRRNLERTNALGVPFVVGVPAYTQGLLLDANGNLAGPYRSLTPLTAAMHPLLREVERTDGPEIRQVFRAVKPNASGEGLGYSLLFRATRPAMVAAYEAEVAANGGENCVGTCRFRLPDPGEGLALPPVVRAPKLTAQPEASRDPWRVVEGQPAPGTSVRLRLANAGGSGTNLTVDIRFESLSLVSASPGGFSRVAPWQGDPSTVGRVGWLRADGLRFTRPGVGEGETVRLGPMELRGRGRIIGNWAVTGLDGRQVTGTLAPISVDDNERKK
jgi:hypothetical protein